MPWRLLTALILELQNFLRMGRLNAPRSVDLLSNLSGKVKRSGDRNELRSRTSSLPKIRSSLIRRVLSPDVLAPAGVGVLAIASWEIFCPRNQYAPLSIAGAVPSLSNVNRLVGRFISVSVSDLKSNGGRLHYSRHLRAVNFSSLYPKQMD